MNITKFLRNKYYIPYLKKNTQPYTDFEHDAEKILQEKFFPETPEDPDHPENSDHP